MADDRTAGQLADAFMRDTRVTCNSADEYTAFVDWAASTGLALDAEVDRETGCVTFTTAAEQEPAPARDLDTLVATLHERGSLVLANEEYPALEEWLRANNVPVHRQVDRKLNRIIVIKRGWGTVEA